MLAALRTAAPRLDDRLVRAAVAWSLHPVSAFEEAADHLVALACGNRSAVERAIRRVGIPAAAGYRRSRDRGDTAGGRADALLRLALARGTWSW
jgi:hypothetical protein